MDQVVLAGGFAPLVYRLLPGVQEHPRTSPALRGGGITQVLAYQVADAVRAGALVVLLPELEEPPLPIQVAFPSTRLLSAKVRTFVDLIVATCDWRFEAL